MNRNLHANHGQNLMALKEPAHSHPHLNMTNANHKLMQELHQQSVSAMKKETQISKRDLKIENNYDTKPIAHKPPIQHSLNEIALKKADKAKSEQRSHTIPSINQSNFDIRNYTINERDPRTKSLNSNSISATIGQQQEKPKVNNLINQFEKANSTNSAENQNKTRAVTQNTNPESTKTNNQKKEPPVLIPLPIPSFQMPHEIFNPYVFFNQPFSHALEGPNQMMYHTNMDNCGFNNSCTDFPVFPNQEFSPNTSQVNNFRPAHFNHPANQADVCSQYDHMQKEQQKQRVVNRLQSKTPPPLPKLKIASPGKSDTSFPIPKNDTLSIPKTPTNSQQSPRKTVTEPQKEKNEHQMVKESYQKAVSNNQQVNHQEQETRHYQSSKRQEYQIVRENELVAKCKKASNESIQSVAKSETTQSSIQTKATQPIHNQDNQINKLKESKVHHDNLKSSSNNNLLEESFTMISLPSSNVTNSIKSNEQKGAKNFKTPLIDAITNELSTRNSELHYTSDFTEFQNTSSSNSNKTLSNTSSLSHCTKQENKQNSQAKEQHVATKQNMPTTKEFNTSLMIGNEFSIDDITVNLIDDINDSRAKKLFVHCAKIEPIPQSNLNMIGKQNNSANHQPSSNLSEAGVKYMKKELKKEIDIPLNADTDTLESYLENGCLVVKCLLRDSQTSHQQKLQEQQKLEKIVEENNLASKMPHDHPSKHLSRSNLLNEYEQRLQEKVERYISKNCIFMTEQHEQHQKRHRNLRQKHELMNSSKEHLYENYLNNSLDPFKNPLFYQSDESINKSSNKKFTRNNLEKSDSLTRCHRKRSGKRHKSCETLLDEKENSNKSVRFESSRINLHLSSQAKKESRSRSKIEERLGSAHNSNKQKYSAYQAGSSNDLIQDGFNCITRDGMDNLYLTYFFKLPHCSPSDRTQVGIENNNILKLKIIQEKPIRSRSKSHKKSSYTSSSSSSSSAIISQFLSSDDSSSSDDDKIKMMLKEYTRKCRLPDNLFEFDATGVTVSFINSIWVRIEIPITSFVDNNSKYNNKEINIDISIKKKLSKNQEEEPNREFKSAWSDCRRPQEPIEISHEFVDQDE